MPTKDPSARLPAGPPACQTYYVVATDTTVEDGPGAWHSVQTVLASASNGFEAVEQARDVLQEGFEPRAAFSREELLAVIETMARHPLAPGESHNLDRQASGAEILAGAKSAAVSLA